jgi:phosphate transport system protein
MADREPVGHQARGALDRGEREIKDEILRMGSLVEGQIRAAIAALAGHDPQAALAVIRNDAQVNAAQREINGRIARTIATQQPVARDLRFLLALDRVAAELERMGDHAASVAKQARKLAAGTAPTPTPELPRMGDLAAELLHGVLRALVDLDVDRARAVAQRDDELDHLFNRSFTTTIERMRERPEAVEPGAFSLFAAYYIERIGDRVTNIAEDVVYLASGQVEDLND